MPVSGSQVLSAIKNNQLVPVFQPIVDLKKGTVSGFEVLARWKHPRRGLILPKNFIHLTGKLGLIDALTEQVLRSAFMVARSAAPGTGLSINISPVQLQNRALPGRLRTLCGETGWPLSQITIEITESAIIDNADMASRVAADLKSMGCRLALDDFGTGYSSLVHLQALPFDELKVDRSFVSEMHRNRESRKIVGAVLELAHNLGLCSVAEGVENEEQCQVLYRLGCQSGQGWLYGKPLTALQLHGYTRCARMPNCRCAADRGPNLLDSAPGKTALDRAAELNALYRDAPIGLGFLDREMRYVSINGKLAEMNGMEEAEHLGKTPREVLPDLFAEIEGPIRAALNGDTRSFELERTQKGKLTSYRVSYAPVRDESEEVIGVSVAVTDVSAQPWAGRHAHASVEHYRGLIQLHPAEALISDCEENLAVFGLELERVSPCRKMGVGSETPSHLPRAYSRRRMRA